MYENKNEQNTGTKTIKKVGKVTYEVVVHFNKNATETMQDKLKRIMLREIESEKHQKNDKNDQKVLDKLLQVWLANLFFGLLVKNITKICRPALFVLLLSV